MTTIEQKKARIAKLRGLGRDVSKYEAKLTTVTHEVLTETADTPVKVVRRGRKPRNG